LRKRSDSSALTSSSRTAVASSRESHSVSLTLGSRTIASSTNRTRYQSRSFNSATAAPRLTVSMPTVFSKGSRRS
jgi:hypothetical protein